MHINWMMTKNPFVARSGTTVGEARRLVQSHHITHLPVVGEHGDVIGMVSAHDLSEDEPAAPRYGQDLTVGAVMTAKPVVVDGEAEVDEAMDLMLECGIGALPVVDGRGEIIGIVSHGDVSRARLGLGRR
jgi:CBS domain-containing protein